MAKRTLRQFIKDIFTGGKSSDNKPSSGRSSSNVKKASGSYYGGGYSSTYRSYGKSYREDEKEKQRQKIKEQNKQTTAKLAAIAKVSQRTDALSSGKKSLPPEPKALANNGVERAIKRIGEKSKVPDPKQAAARSAKERAEATRKKTTKTLRVKSPEEMIASGDYQRAEAPRNANTRSADERPSVVLSRQGLEKLYQDPVYVGAQTVGRRLVEGASLGTLKPFLKGGSDSPYEQMQEELYQQHENKILGGAAELVGSALTFGLTAGATDALGGQIIGRIAPNAAEKLGASAVGRGLATRAVNKQIKKGIVKEASEELIKQVGKEKAEQILARLGGETVQNLTTGAIYDIANATNEYELFSPEWWNEIGRSAKWNAGITGGLAALPFLGAGNRRIVRNSLNALADNRGVREAVESTAESLSGNRIAEIDRELDELYNAIARNGDMSEEGLSGLIKRTNDLKAERAALEESVNAVEPPRIEDVDTAPPKLEDVETTPPKLEDVEAEIKAEAKEASAKAKKPVVKEAPAETVEPPRTKGDVRQELKALREEHWNLAEKIKAEFGDANPKLEELSDAERKTFFERKSRLREISDKIDALHKELDEVPEGAPRAKPEPVKNAEPSKPAVEDTVEATAKTVNPEDARAEIRREMDEAYEEATRKGISEEERQAASDRFYAAQARLNALDEASETASKNSSEGIHETLRDDDVPLADKSAAEEGAKAEKNARPLESNGKKSPPIKETKTKRRKRLERAEIDEKYERAHEKLGKKTRNESGNTRNVRAGARVAEIIGSDENAKEFLYQAERRLKGIEDEASASGLRIEYTRENEVDRAARIRKSYDRLDKLGAQGVIDDLKGFLKSDRPLAEQDVADVIVLENYYDLIGKKMPKRFERVCNEIILRQRTESGQLANSVHLLLKEHSPKYRRKYIDKGFEKFREFICRQDNWDDIKRSLNKNHEEFLEKNAKWFEENDKPVDWLEYQLDRLAHFEGTEAEYRREVNRLQNQIFRNSKPSNWDVLNMIRYSAMLSKPATALRNIYGNVSQRLMYDISDKINNVIEVGMERSNNSRKAALEKQITATESKLKALKKGSEEYKRVTGELDNLKNELAGREKFERTTTVLKNKDDILWTQELTEGKIGGKEKLEKQIQKATEDLGKMDEGSAEYKELKSQIDEMEEALKTGSKSKARFKSLRENEYYSKLNEYLADDHPQMMGEPKYGQKSQRGSDYIYEKGGRIKKKLAKAGELGGKYTDITLNEPDSWFVERNYRSALLKYLKANGIDSIEKIEANPEVVQRARQHAMEVAKENTYKRNYELVNFLERTRQKGYNKNAKFHNKVATFALDAELPFLKVPVNMIVNNFKYNPISLATNAKKAVSAMKHNDIRAAQEACRELSKSLTGTGIALLGYYLSVDEQGDEGKGLIAHADEQLKPYGVRDYSLQWDDKNMALSDVGIGVPQLMMGVAVAEMKNAQGGVPSSSLNLEDLVNAFGMTVDVPTDQSLLDNVMDIIDAGGQGYDYGKGAFDRGLGVAEKVVTDYIGQPIPTWMRGIAGGMTSSDLDTNTKKGKSNLERQLKRNANNLISAVPVVNEKVLPHKVDAHGNYVNERTTSKAKLKQIGINTFDPLATKTVRIPKADKFELAAKNDNGEGYVPKPFDADRTYQAKIGRGDTAETFDLTGKEREQAAHSVQNSGKDMANAIVYAKPAYFGDSHSERAQQILRECPENQEEAREYLYSQPEIQKLSDAERRKVFDIVYYGYGGDKGHLGRDRASNHAVYVDIKGGNEDDFRFMNDLSEKEQSYYNDAELGSRGVSKAVYADAIDAIHYAAHKFKDGENRDDTKGKKTTIAGILSLGLSPEENIAIYEAYRGKNNWKDWDGISGVSSGWRRYGRGYRHWGHGGSSGKAKVPTPKKMGKLTAGEALVSKKKSSSSKANVPTLKRVEAKIDLPTAKYSKQKRG